MAYDKGFSYESPEKQRKGAARLFIIEMSVLVMVIVLILGLLVYLGIIPINKRNSNPEGQTPSMGKGRGKIEPLNTTPAPTIAITPKLEVISEHPDYEVTISEEAKQRLIGIIQQWPHYGKKYYDPIEKKDQVIETYKIIFTNTPGNSEMTKDSSGDTLSSMDFKYAGSIFENKVYLSPEVMKRSREEVEDIFLGMVLHKSYTVSNYVGEQDELQDSFRKISEILEKEKGNEYFKITDK